MSSRKPARTARRLLKVASLGLAGLIAGLLGGCSSDSLARFSNWHSRADLTATRRLQNLDYRSSPEIRRAPTSHRMQPNSAQRTSTQASFGEIDAIGHHYESHESHGGQ
jgi:hypothetical protein